MSCCCCDCESGSCCCGGFSCDSCGTCCCGQNSCGTSMSTVNPNASVNQAMCCCSGDGGASSLSTALNSIGKFGSLLTGAVTGKVPAPKTGVAVVQKSNTTLIIMILAVVGVLIYLGTRG